MTFNLMLSLPITKVKPVFCVAAFWSYMEFYNKLSELFIG